MNVDLVNNFEHDDGKSLRAAVNIPASGERKLFLRAAMRFAVFIILAVHAIIKQFLISLFVKDNSTTGSKTIHELNRILVKVLGIKIQSRGVIPPAGAVIVSNHRSYIDISLISSSVRCQFLAKSELRSWPLLGYGAYIMGVIFVSRESSESRAEALTEIKRFAESGGSIVIFPEGTSTAGPGILPFKSGAFRIAAASGKPVVPVSIRYKDQEDAWVGDDTFTSHFFRVFSKKQINAWLSFGPAISGDNPDELKTKAEDWIKNSLAGK